MDLSGLTEGAQIAITADITDLAGNRGVQDSTTVTKDTLSTTLAINDPVVINLANQASYPISGTCTNYTSDVQVIVVDGAEPVHPYAVTLLWGRDLGHKRGCVGDCRWHQ